MTKEKEQLSEMQKLKGLAENKSEYIDNISHEIRTPLNVMFGAIQLFEMYINEDLKANKLKIIKHTMSMKQNCLRLVRLVNNLIDATKIDAGHYEIKLQNCDIVKLIKNITLSVSEYAKLNDIKLAFNTKVKEKIIACDCDAIERIMLNLISNAIKFTNSKGIIQIHIENTEDKILITVSDNGIGIPLEMQNLIFERYKQGKNLLARDQEGSGIGLSLIKSLIEMHGGTISLESDSDSGSKFIVELPIRLISVSEIDDKHINCKNNIKRIVEKMNVEFSDIYN